MDQRVLQVQQWLNATYGNDSRFNRVTEDGITGWGTIYGLRRALQIELGIQETSNSFGPTTYSLCPTIAQGDENNLVYIVQGGLWCKGYNPGGFTGYYGNGTYAAVKALKTDAGFPSASGNMNRDFMKALLDMSAFTCVSGGKEEIRTIQQKLNYDYYDYYQICPCDGLYNRDMNKMLIYALQKEEGISKSSATGAWGPSTISKCPTLSLGDSNNYVKLVRYALVCNGYSVDTSSALYDSALDSAAANFANSLKITKPSNKIDYAIIKSLLSSNGDTNRAAIGCDTATKLTVGQIQTIKNAGYQYVGRYLTNTPGGTLDKCLTREEILNIFDAGLKLFPIFQESGNSANAFTASTGATNAQRAFEAAEEFGIPHGSTIYFAVDFDATDTVISSNIIPYFRAITSSNVGKKFRVGVYGTRNVCSRLKEEIGINRFFVSDSSYGFSGNLGFVMPTNWCFDQFAVDITIGSGENAVSIDKVAVSGVDKGVSQLTDNIVNKILDFLKPFGHDDKLDLAVDYTEPLVLEYIKPATSLDPNYIMLKVENGVTSNPDAAIVFDGTTITTTTLDQLWSDDFYAGLDNETKMSLLHELNAIGFSVGYGNLDVVVMTVVDRENSGVIVSYELTTPLNTDETVYSKISLMFKLAGNVTLDLSTVQVTPTEALALGSLYAFVGIGIICGPSFILNVLPYFGILSQDVVLGIEQLIVNLLNRLGLA